MYQGIMSKYSDEEFIEIVKSSYSLTEVTKRLGYQTFKSGGGRNLVKDRIAMLGIDISHFRSHGRQYEKPPRNKITNIDDIFKNPSNTPNITLCNIILREKLLEYKCSECGNPGVWNNKPLQLQLHHKNGERTNNELTNLIFLCPNCHTQTDNYGGKNVKTRMKKKYYCTNCGNEITKDTQTGLCKKCANKKIFQKDIPSKESLINTIKEIKYKKYICFKYGICEHTLNSWLKQYGMPTHISEVHEYIMNNNL